MNRLAAIAAWTLHETSSGVGIKSGRTLGDEEGIARYATWTFFNMGSSMWPPIVPKDTKTS